MDELEQLQAEMDATREPVAAPEGAMPPANPLGMAFRAVTNVGGGGVGTEIGQRLNAPAQPADKPLSQSEEMAKAMDATRFDGGPVEAFFAGAVDRLAETMGLAPDALMTAMQNGGQDYMQAKDIQNTPMGVASPGEMAAADETVSAAEENVNPHEGATKALKEAFSKLGLPTDAPDTMAAEIGESTMTGLMILGAIVATKGKLRAIGTPSATAKVGERIMRAIPRWLGKMGESAAAQPVAAVASEVGGAAGAEVGEDAGGLPGAIAGGIGGALSAPTALKTLGKVAGKATGMVGLNAAGRGLVNVADKGIRALAGQPLPKEPPSLLSGATDPEAAIREAGAYVTRETAIVENKIKQTIENMQPKDTKRGWYTPLKDSEKVQGEFAQGMNQAEELGNTIQRKLWTEAVAGKQAMTENLQIKMDEIIEFNVANQSENALPKAQIDEIQGLDPVVNAAKLVNIRSEIGDLIRLGKSREGEILGATKISNLRKISGAILDTLNAQLASPGAKVSRKLTSARAFSARMAELFDQGPVGDAMALARTGESKVDPQLMAQHLLKTVGGTDQLKAIPGALAKGQRAVKDMTAVPDIERMFADGVRDLWAQSTKGLTPEAAGRASEAFIKANGPRFQKNARLYAEIKNANDELASHVAERKAIQDGVVAKLSGQDVEAGINSILTSPNPTAKASELMAALKDPDAIRAIQERTLERLIVVSGTKPTKLLSQLNDSKVGRMLQVMFRSNPEALNRFRRIVETSSRIENGDEKAVAKGARRAGVFVSKFFGAGVGRYLAGKTGGGAIQKAHYMAEAFRTGAEYMLGAMPTEELVASAAFDPKWERLLFSRVPVHDRDSRHMLRNLQLLIGAQQGWQTDMERTQREGTEP